MCRLAGVHLRAGPGRAADRAGVGEDLVAANATLNNKGAGGLTLRVTSNDRPQLGLVFLAPVLGTLWNAVLSRRGGGAGGEEEGYGGEEEGY